MDGNFPVSSVYVLLARLIVPIILFSSWIGNASVLSLVYCIYLIVLHVSPTIFFSTKTFPTFAFFSLSIYSLVCLCFCVSVFLHYYLSSAKTNLFGGAFQGIDNVFFQGNNDLLQDIRFLLSHLVVFVSTFPVIFLRQPKGSINEGSLTLMCLKSVAVEKLWWLPRGIQERNVQMLEKQKIFSGRSLNSSGVSMSTDLTKQHSNHFNHFLQGYGGLSWSLALLLMSSISFPSLMNSLFMLLLVVPAIYRTIRRTSSTSVQQNIVTNIMLYSRIVIAIYIVSFAIFQTIHNFVNLNYSLFRLFGILPVSLVSSQSNAENFDVHERWCGIFSVGSILALFIIFGYISIVVSSSQDKRHVFFPSGNTLPSGLNDDPYQELSMFAERLKPIYKEILTHTFAVGLLVWTLTYIGVFTFPLLVYIVIYLTNTQVRCNGVPKIIFIYTSILHIIHYFVIVIAPLLDETVDTNGNDILRILGVPYSKRHTFPLLIQILTVLMMFLSIEILQSTELQEKSDQIAKENDKKITENVDKYETDGHNIKYLLDILSIGSLLLSGMADYSILNLGFIILVVILFSFEYKFKKSRIRLIKSLWYFIFIYSLLFLLLKTTACTSFKPKYICKQNSNSTTTWETIFYSTTLLFASIQTNFVWKYIPNLNPNYIHQISLVPYSARKFNEYAEQIFLLSILLASIFLPLNIFSNVYLFMLIIFVFIELNVTRQQWRLKLERVVLTAMTTTVVLSIFVRYTAIILITLPERSDLILGLSSHRLINLGLFGHSRPLENTLNIARRFYISDSFLFFILVVRKSVRFRCTHKNANVDLEEEENHDRTEKECVSVFLDLEDPENKFAENFEEPLSRLMEKGSVSEGISNASNTSDENHRKEQVNQILRNKEEIEVALQVDRPRELKSPIEGIETKEVLHFLMQMQPLKQAEKSLSDLFKEIIVLGRHFLKHCGLATQIILMATCCAFFIPPSIAGLLYFTICFLISYFERSTEDQVEARIAFPKISELLRKLLIFMSGIFVVLQYVCMLFIQETDELVVYLRILGIDGRVNGQSLPVSVASFLAHLAISCYSLLFHWYRIVLKNEMEMSRKQYAYSHMEHINSETPGPAYNNVIRNTREEKSGSETLKSDRSHTSKIHSFRKNIESLSSQEAYSDPNDSFGSEKSHEPSPYVRELIKKSWMSVKKLYMFFVEEASRFSDHMAILVLLYSTILSTSVFSILSTLVVIILSNASSTTLNRKWKHFYVIIASLSWTQYFVLILADNNVFNERNGVYLEPILLPCVDRISCSTEQWLLVTVTIALLAGHSIRNKKEVQIGGGERISDTDLSIETDSTCTRVLDNVSGIQSNSKKVERRSSHSKCSEERTESQSLFEREETTFIKPMDVHVWLKFYFLLYFESFAKLYLFLIATPYTSVTHSVLLICFFIFLLKPKKPTAEKIFSFLRWLSICFLLFYKVNQLLETVIDHHDMSVFRKISGILGFYDVQTSKGSRTMFSIFFLWVISNFLLWIKKTKGYKEVQQYGRNDAEVRFKRALQNHNKRKYEKMLERNNIERERFSRETRLEKLQAKIHSKSTVDALYDVYVVEENIVRNGRASMGIITGSAYPEYFSSQEPEVTTSDSTENVGSDRFQTQGHSKLFRAFVKGIKRGFSQFSMWIPAVVIILTSVLNPSVNTLFYLIYLFLFLLIENPRPSKEAWNFLIAFTCIFIVTKYCVRGYLDIFLGPTFSQTVTCTEVPFFSSNELYYRVIETFGKETPGIFGVPPCIFVQGIGYDIMVLMALFIHRTVLFSNGLWDLQGSEEDMLLQANIFGESTKSYGLGKTSDCSWQTRDVPGLSFNDKDIAFQFWSSETQLNDIAKIFGRSTQEVYEDSIAYQNERIKSYEKRTISKRTSRQRLQTHFTSKKNLAESQKSETVPSIEIDFLGKEFKKSAEERNKMGSESNKHMWTYSKRKEQKGLKFSYVRNLARSALGKSSLNKTEPRYRAESHEEISKLFTSVSQIDNMLTPGSTKAESFDRGFSSLSSKNKKGFFQNISSFYARTLKENGDRPVGDYYMPMFIVDFTCFIYVMFAYSSIFTEFSSTRESFWWVTNFIETNHLVTILLMFFAIILDRVFYVRRNARGKLVLHYSSIIIYHVVLFISQGSIRYKTSTRIFYLMKCVYFFLSGIQLRDGFPQYTVSQLLVNNFRGIGIVLFEIYMFIPFLWLCRTLLDWTILPTSLEIFQYFRLNDIHSWLYRNRAVNGARGSFRRIRGEKRRNWPRLYQGYGLFLLCVVALFLPLLIFSIFNPLIVRRDLDVSTMFIGLRKNSTNTDETFVSGIYQRTTVLHKLEDRESQNNVSGELGIDLDVRERDNLFYGTFRESSEIIWEPSTSDIRDLNRKNQNGHRNISLEFFSKTFTKNNKMFVTRRLVYGLEETESSNLSSALSKGKDLAMIIPWNIDNYFILDPRNNILDEQNTNQDKTANTCFILRRIYENIDNDEEFDRSTRYFLSLYHCGQRCICNLNSFKQEQFRIIFQIRDISSLQVGGATILTLYTAILFTIANLLKNQFIDKRLILAYSDMPYTLHLYQLVMDIVHARQDKNLEMEEILFNGLIDVYRNQNELSSWTGERELKPNKNWWDPRYANPAFRIHPSFAETSTEPYRKRKVE